MQTRIFAKLSPNRHCNLSPVRVDWAVEVIMFSGTKVGVNWREASKIWWSLRRFFQDVLWCEEHVRAESCNPRRQRDDVAITLFLVHCGHDLLAFLVDGRMVSHAPVKEGIVSRCRCVEDGGGTSVHDADVVV